MPSTNFSSALSYVLVNEGGATYTDDPLDAGGPTKYGCTLATLSAWRVKQGRAPATAADVKGLTLAEASDIYAATYWLKVGGDSIADSAVATVLLDCAVLTGVTWAATGAQALAGQITGATVATDGAIGPKSLAAINACGRRPFLEAMVARQNTHFMDIVAANATQRKFLKGWAKRVSQYLDLNW